MGASENFIATVGKSTEKRVAVNGEEIVSIYNESGDKVALYTFAGMTNDRRVLIHKRTGGSKSTPGKSGKKTQKITLTLHQSLRFANGSRIICLDVEPDRLTYRRVSM